MHDKHGAQTGKMVTSVLTLSPPLSRSVLAHALFACIVCTALRPHAQALMLKRSCLCPHAPCSVLFLLALNVVMYSIVCIAIAWCVCVCMCMCIGSSTHVKGIY